MMGTRVWYTCDACSYVRALIYMYDTYVHFLVALPWAGRVVIASIQRTRTSISQSEAFNFDIGYNFST